MKEIKDLNKAEAELPPSPNHRFFLSLTCSFKICLSYTWHCATGFTGWSYLSLTAPPWGRNSSHLVHCRYGSKAQRGQQLPYLYQQEPLEPSHFLREFCLYPFFQSLQGSLKKRKSKVRWTFIFSDRNLDINRWNPFFKNIWYVCRSERDKNKLPPDEEWRENRDLSLCPPLLSNGSSWWFLRMSDIFHKRAAC